MNDFRHMIMDEPDDFTEDELSSRTERRLLVIGLCLSYLACLVALWFLGNLPGSPHDLLWRPIGVGRFVLLVVPLAVLCACYFGLRRTTGEIMELRGKKLDERQRMVRDQAYRYAYKIITIACLLLLVYLAIHSLLIPATLPAPSIITPALPMARVIIVDQAGHQSIMYHALGTLRNPPPPPIFVHQSVSPVVSWFTIRQAITPAPVVSSTDPLSLGIYYGLFLVTILLIVTTLPRAIIAWKEQ